MCNTNDWGVSRQDWNLLGAIAGIHLANWVILLVGDETGRESGRRNGIMCLELVVSLEVANEQV
jgi:hypothetical protein